jgi:hypothetical protein
MILVLSISSQSNVLKSSQLLIFCANLYEGSQQVSQGGDASLSD